MKIFKTISSIFLPITNFKSINKFFFLIKLFSKSFIAFPYLKKAIYIQKDSLSIFSAIFEFQYFIIFIITLNKF